MTDQLLHTNNYNCHTGMHALLLIITSFGVCLIDGTMKYIKEKCIYRECFIEEYDHFN